MALRISLCEYRLLFKRPFGTAHGLRNGTDALFIRVEERGFTGYGEVTLPPYLEETIPGAIDRITSIAGKGPWSADGLLAGLDRLPEFGLNTNGSRAGLHMALLDLIGQRDRVLIKHLLQIDAEETPITLMTIGICDHKEVPSRLAELPDSGALKLKIGDPDAMDRVTTVKWLDNRMLFLDGNQGYSSVKEVVKLVEGIGTDRFLGIEQPFTAKMDGSNPALARATRIPVYGDESIQSLGDIVEVGHLFQGVNVKLMKCGGLDRAAEMIRRARSKGLHIMLGSMSESSLGCTAMAHLGCAADLVDLDGPWLIKNDPFLGVKMENGRMIKSQQPGLGVTMTVHLNFAPIGA
ncbi:MAG: hypothetical protein IPP83_08005 [Flavobacteriales bacterium]|nr:hypothetical protein [Flavobacteriales bacterium]